MCRFSADGLVLPESGAQVKLLRITRKTCGEISFGEKDQLRLSLSDFRHMAETQPPAHERRPGAAGPCTEWEFVLHAYFDGELDPADSFICEQHLAQCLACSLEIENLHAMRRKIRRFAMGWHAPAALRTRSTG
jgi:hypothetical protein